MGAGLCHQVVKHKTDFYFAQQIKSDAGIEMLVLRERCNEHGWFISIVV